MSIAFIKRPALTVVTDLHYIPIQKEGGPASRVNAAIFTASVVSRAAEAATSAGATAGQGAGASAGAEAGRSAAANAIQSMNLAQVIAQAVSARLTELGYTGTTPVVPTEPTTPVPTSGYALRVTGSNGTSWTQSINDIAVADSQGLRAQIQVPSSVVGVTSMRLVADLGTTWCDVSIRNDGAARRRSNDGLPDNGGGSTTYSAVLFRDGVEVFRRTDWPVPQYTWDTWPRIAAPGTEPYTLVSGATLIAAKKVAPYARGAVAETTLTAYAAAVANASWTQPGSARGLSTNMPGTGGRDDIGPTTMAQAAALCTDDPRAINYIIGQAEAAGGIPWHYWDASHGRYMSVDDYPGLWTDGRGIQQAGGTLMQPVPNEVWELDSAHQPDTAYVPYLMTGRRMFYDEVMAQGAWNIVYQWDATRGVSQMNLINGNQVRGAAWAVRQIDDAKHIAAPGSYEADYFTRASDVNWQWALDQRAVWATQQGEVVGWVRGVYGSVGSVPPWQQDYFASTAAAAARQGNTKARDFLAWMAQFQIRRFTELGHTAVTYLLALSDATTNVPYTTWNEVRAQNVVRDYDNGDGWAHSGGNFGQLSRFTLLCLAEILQTPNSKQWAAYIISEGAPFTDAGTYLREPALRLQVPA